MASDSQMTKCPQCGNAFPRSVKLCPNDGAVLEHGEGSASHVGEVLDGKYRLDGFLSQGGMGAVYKGTHVMLGRSVAVKLINPEYVASTEAVRRFQREARAATSLNHPNIVGVYDLGQTPQGTLYIAMEFVDGPSLKSVITRGGAVAPGRTIALVRQVAHALAAAHRQNIVHRDLKPQNVMLTRGADGQELVKLVDFGIAKTFDDSTQLTMSGATMGTPQYMSPEQAAGQEVDARSDLYSLGVVLYEMLSGDVPFNDKSATSIIVKHIKETPQPPSLKNPAVTVHPELEAIALRCLEKDPAKRFQTAEDFIAALDTAAAAIPGAGDAMPATLPAMPAALPPMQPTIPARQATVRKVEPPAPATVRVGADTRSTAAARPPAPEPIVPRPASNRAAGIILVAAVALAAAGAALYLLRPGQSPVVSSGSDVPAAAPASAVEPPAAVPPGAASAVPASALPQSQNPPPAPAGPVAAGNAEPAPPRQASSAGGRGQSQPSASTPASSAAVIREEPSPRDADPGRLPNPQPQQPPPPQFPDNPAVYFHCAGAAEICSALRAAVDEALDAGGLSAVRSAARADVDVAATVEGVQEAVSRQFQTTFAVRTYTIDVTAGTTRTDEAVPMPPPSNLSFDPQFGSARIAERARLVAADIVERVKAFARKKRGG